MIRDQGASYRLGFGIRPSEVPIRSDENGNEETGLGPNSSVIAKALYGHPVAKFLATGAATMVGMAVAGAIAKKGGVRLGEKLGAESIPFIRKTAQRNVLHEFRSAQKTLDEWEGLARDPITGVATKKSSYWLTQARKDKAAEDRLNHGWSEDVADWTWKDELQQRLVHQARALPYQLPALYVANRFANNVVGNQNSQVNWHNPLDVIGDFAESSVKNTATLLAPVEIGHTAVKQGWRNLMSDGDFVSNTSTFSGLRKYGVGLKSVLDQLGQDTTSILHQTSKYSRQTAGSFASALKHYSEEKEPLGFNPLSRTKEGIKANTNTNNTLLGLKRLHRIKDSYESNGPFSALQEVNPSITGFVKGFGRSWGEFEDQYQNAEAVLRGDDTYTVGKDRTLFGHQFSSRTKTVDPRRIHTRSYLGDVARSLEHQSDSYSETRTNEAYRQLLEKHLMSGLSEHQQAMGFKGPARRPIVQQFMHHADISSPTTNRDSRTAFERVRFGKETLVDNPVNKFSARINPVLQGAVERADKDFFEKDFQSNLQKRIGEEFSDIRRRVVAPEVRRQLGESPLDYHDFGRNITPNRHELLLRKTAQVLGIGSDSETLTSADIRKHIAARGIDTSNPYQMRAILTDEGVMGKPWQQGGFNILGLRPLSAQSALDKHYFGSEEEPLVRKLLGEVGAADHPYVRNLVNRPVGKNVWESRSGRIVDLNPIVSGIRNTVQSLARDTQVPLLHFSVLDLTSANAMREMATSSAVRIQPARFTNFGTLGSELQGAESHVWVRGASGRARTAAKGRIAGYTYGETPKWAQGRYYAPRTGGAGATDEMGTWQRSLRVALRDKGVFTPPPSKNPDFRTRMARVFRQAPEQSNSLPSAANRFVHGVFGEKYLSRLPGFERSLNHPDLTNPAVVARELGKDFKSVVTREDAQRLIGIQKQVGAFREAHLKGDSVGDANFLASQRHLGKLISGKADENLLHDDVLTDLKGHMKTFEGGDLTADQQKQLEDIRSSIRRHESERSQSHAKAIERLEKEVHKFQITPKVAHLFGEMNPDLKSIFSVGTEDGERSLSDVRDPHEMVRLARQSFTHQIEEAEARVREASIDPNLAQEARRKLAAIRASQAFVKKTYLKSDPQTLLDPSPRTQSIGGINTRLDEMRSDLYRQAVAYQGVTNDGTELTIQHMLSSIDKMASEGRISRSRVTEARAAVLSMQMNLASLNAGSRISTLERYERMGEVLASSESAQVPLSDIAKNYHTVVNHTRFLGLERHVSRWFKGNFGLGEQEFHGHRYNPFGGAQSHTFVPTFGTAFASHPFRALKSAAGFSTWNDPEAFSSAGIRTTHLATRLNRYFQVGGMGVDETKYKGPIGFLNRGLVGRRILPIVAGVATLIGVDREAGGIVHGKDQYGNRQYRPLITGALATGAAHLDVAATTILRGRERGHEKHEQYFGDEDVPIRRGRYWPLGSQPFRGGRVMYYRPNWYRRFMSGYQYTSDTYGSPLEHLAFDEDYSPLHYIDPYHFERKHYKDRPYPVTGDLFTGPWGPLTTQLNATIGKVLKPHLQMHKEEMAHAMSQYQRIGQNGMVAPTGYDPGEADVLHTPQGTIRFQGSEKGSDQPVLASTASEYSSAPSSIDSSATTVVSGSPQGTGFAPGNANLLHTPHGSIYLNKSNNINFGRQVVPAANPLNPGHWRYQSGKYGYEAQEMAGIYGFAFGSAREMLNMGASNYTPKAPVLQSASRAYGSERAFWGMNLGGLGDFPTPLRGEYGNLEFSEIARRFIPHRRSDEVELNPLQNEMGKKYPWLPGNDYFKNFHQGDPFLAVQEGEMRLPGKGYSLLHNLHPDATGQYGILDQHRILGDVAPWSQEYKDINRYVSHQKLTDEQQAYIDTTREHVSEMNKKHDFRNYGYRHADIQHTEAKVTGFMPGNANELITNQGVVKLAGVSVKQSLDAMDFAQKLVHKGDIVNLAYDANAGTGYAMPRQAYVTTSQGKSINDAFLNSGLATQDEDHTPLENAQTHSSTSFKIHSLLERFSHSNTVFNQKFMPDRTAQEDWEHFHVYGTDFPQWTHPLRDFIYPMMNKARNRNPIYAGGVLGVVGKSFGRTPQGKVFGRLAGTVTGFALGATSTAKTQQTGERYIPSKRQQELNLEEYTDMLNYLKYDIQYSKYRQMAIDKGNADPDKYLKRGAKAPDNAYTQMALQAHKQMQRTMYGADLFGNPADEAAALPKRKRDYFNDLLNSPISERKSVLSTAPRLERRMYEARWGMPIEQRPDLVDYFSHHELPGPNWEGWDGSSNMQNVELKMVQHQGLDASQMGFYPQEVQQANLLNPSYPNYNQQTNPGLTANNLRSLLHGSNVSIDARRTSTPGVSVKLNAGTYQ